VDQIQIVKEQIKNSPYPIIICGDLNEIPISYVYNQLTESLNDAFLEKGNGLGVTHSSNYPFMRIDYVFTSNDLVVKGFNLIEKELSDHYPIVAEISFKDSI
jgi:endonuclease/exonuclease/phosphatase family metal-dependent hydrolase